MKKIILIITLLMSLTFISATTISFNFNTSQNSIQERLNTAYPKSLILQIITENNPVICRYSKTGGTSFDSMEGSFDIGGEIIYHKKTLTGLENGIHKYYIKCDNGVTGNKSELKVTFIVDNPISAQIILDDNILDLGKHELNLITTKVPASTPSLSYSYDGITHTPIILFGSGINWKGYIVIPKSSEEKVGSFKFSATDLEGNPGTEIINNNVFMVDTKTPLTISTFKAIGEYGQVRLEWFIEKGEEVSQINIYKSENPNVRYSDLYKSTSSDNEYYTDTDVSKGKTYYYRIASEDSAENLADLSKEVKATSRTDNKTTSTGLSSELISTVDAVLTEASLLRNDIVRAKSLFGEKDEIEKAYLQVLGITNSLESSSSELSALEREITNYKLQDLTSDTLDTRLASSRSKLNIIKKKIPSGISITDSSEKAVSITEESIRIVLVDYASELTPSQIDKTVKHSQKLTEESEIKIKSKINIFEITYLDGTKSSKTIVEHFLDSALEKSDSTLFLLKIPSSIESNSIKMKNTDYSEEASGLFRFETDAKKITYIINSKQESDILNQINVALIQTIEEDSSLTGYFLLDLPSTGSIGITFLIIFACFLIGYLGLMKKQQGNNSIKSFIEKARTVKDLQKKGESEKASTLYSSLQLDYTTLSNEEKSKVFKEIKYLSNNKK